jgi:hypothetical protein
LCQRRKESSDGENSLEAFILLKRIDERKEIQEFILQFYNI